MDAIDSLEESGRWEPDVQFRFWQVIWLLNFGDLDAARTYLGRAELEIEGQKKSRISRLKELTRLRSIFKAIDEQAMGQPDTIVDPIRLDDKHLPDSVRLFGDHDENFI